MDRLFQPVEARVCRVEIESEKLYIFLFLFIFSDFLSVFPGKLWRQTYRPRIPWTLA